MADFFSSLSLFPLALTFGAFSIGLWCQKKTGSPLCNPILIGAALVVGVLLLLDYSPELYQSGTNSLSWFLTPATICLALPLYQQLKILKKICPPSSQVFLPDLWPDWQLSLCCAGCLL